MSALSEMKIPDDEFVRIYRVLVKHSRRPACAMGELLNLSPGTVRNKVARLRREGLLGPANGTRAGEVA